MPFTIVRQDITKIEADAIVNAANIHLQMGGGVCGAIFKAAGAAKLQTACERLAPIKTGEAVITPAFDLPARFIIHAAGPVYRKSNNEQNERELRAAYENSLKRAVANGCESVAFPLISSGIYGYPKDEALRVATSAIQDFLTDHDLDVTLVVFDKESFSISRDLLGAVESYIDEHYIDQHRIKRRRQLPVLERETFSDADEAAIQYNQPVFDKLSAAPVTDSFAAPVTAPAAAHSPLDHLIGNLDEPFSKTLLRLIDTKEMTDVEVYKRANLDRKLFSKIRSNKGYTPSKRTAIALAVALRLSLDETADLLYRAGYALSHAVKFDVIVEYFIRSGKYDVFEINAVLFAYDLPLLGM